MKAMSIAKGTEPQQDMTLHALPERLAGAAQRREP